MIEDEIVEAAVYWLNMRGKVRRALDAKQAIDMREPAYDMGWAENNLAAAIRNNYPDAGFIDDFEIKKTGYIKK